MNKERLEFVPAWLPRRRAPEKPAIDDAASSPFGFPIDAQGALDSLKGGKRSFPELGTQCQLKINPGLEDEPTHVGRYVREYAERRSPCRGCPVQALSSPVLPL